MFDLPKKPLNASGFRIFLDSVRCRSSKVEIVEDFRWNFIRDSNRLVESRRIAENTLSFSELEEVEWLEPTGWQQPIIIN